VLDASSGTVFRAAVSQIETPKHRSFASAPRCEAPVSALVPSLFKWIVDE